MQYDDDLFRKQFPEFSDKTKFPPEKLGIFWSVAASFVDTRDSPCRILSGDALVYALNLLTAHLLTLSMQAAESMNGGASGGGGVPGQTGFITSAHIDEVSVTKMQPPVKDGWQFWLSSTPYGTQLWAILSMLAVGGISVGGLPERTGFRKVGGVFL